MLSCIQNITINILKSFTSKTLYGYCFRINFRVPSDKRNAQKNYKIEHLTT